jgi:hypothetical protein
VRCETLGKKKYIFILEKNADDTYALTIVYIDNQIQTDTRKTITCIMRLKLMSDVQYLSPKRAVKVRDQSFLLGVSIKHRYCGGGESTPTNNTPTVRLANVRSKCWKNLFG